MKKKGSPKFLMGVLAAVIFVLGINLFAQNESTSANDTTSISLRDELDSLEADAVFNADIPEAEENFEDDESYIPPVRFQKLTFSPIDFEEDTHVSVYFTVSPLVLEGAEIASVEVGLMSFPEKTSTLLFNPQTGDWEGKVLLQSENLENGKVFATATLLENDSYPKALSFSTNAGIFPEYNRWARRSNTWRGIIDFALISAFMAIAMFMRRKVKFLTKYLVPPAMLAGFIGLAFRLLAEWVGAHFNTNFLSFLEFSPDRLGNMVYHLMAIGFIGIALEDGPEEESQWGGDSLSTGVSVISYYMIQGFIGFSITLLLFYTFMPQIFPAFGLLLPLGFGQGPGQAYSIGTTWEDVGFLYGGNIGLTIATFGFLWACFGGVPLMNWLIKSGRMKPQSSLYGKSVEETRDMTKDLLTDSDKDVPLSESIDRITIQAFLVGITYLLTYGGISLICWIFGLIAEAAPGSSGTMQQLTGLMWGFNFIFGSLFATLVKKAMYFFKKRGWMHRNYPNNYILQRLSGGAFDFMITAAVIAISIPVLFDYAVPIILIVVVGGFVTMGFVLYVAKKYFPKYPLEYALALFGMGTGTISSGLILLKEIDPTFETPAAKDMVFGSAVAFPLGIPLMLILTVPIIGYANNKPILYLFTLLFFVAYLLFLLSILNRRNKKRAKKASENKDS